MLPCAVFALEDQRRRGQPVYWIYNYKRGSFYPFVPTPGEQQRDNERELVLKAQIGAELPLEQELKRWFPPRGEPDLRAGSPGQVHPALAAYNPASVGSVADAAGRDRPSGSARWVIRLAGVGAALGASQIVHGAYDEATWGPIALGALGLFLAVAVVLGAQPRLSLPALIPLLGLWLWSLLSVGWSESADAAHLGASRWLLYATVFALISVALGEDRRRGSLLLAGASAGVLAVAGWMLVRMLGGHGASLFLSTRLNDPLGYVNGEGGYLLVALWPCLALAERPRGRAAPALAGAGVAGVIVLVGLGLLTQSRSFGLGLIGSSVLVLVAIPGRRRRAAAMLLAGAAITSIYAEAARVWRHPNPLTGVVTSGATRHAAIVILAAAVLAGLAWGIAVGALERVAPTGSQARVRAVRSCSAALIALGLAAFVALGLGAGRIATDVHRQYDAFVHLAPSPGATRLLSGGGNRFDYWRIAMIELRSAPVEGVGAGNYQPGYYLHRRTAEAIQQPHSLELQTLSELGLVGGLLLLAFLAAVALGLARTARQARRDPLARGTAVAAGGTFTGWLIQTSVDWLHLFTGLTAIALAGAAALVVRPSAGRLGVGGRAHLAVIAFTGVIACAGTLTIAPRVLSLHASAAAQHALADGSARVAIADASRSLNYDSSSVPVFVLRAAGFARLHAFVAARADLRRAIALEPRNWVTWALLGDLLTRRGDRLGARSSYSHASRLNPREPALRSALATAAQTAKR